jgi:hypothetical protein
MLLANFVPKKSPAFYFHKWMSSIYHTPEENLS